MDPVNIANQVVAGVLTGLVYGLMALGLSVIFGVVRVVNFAHGEMMTIAMYATVVLFAALGLDPFLAIVPVAIAFFVFGYALQAALINPFITRPEHSQFMLLVAVAIIMVNALLMIFGPDARNVQLDYLLESIELGPLLLDRGKLYGAIVACVTSGLLFAFFKLTRTGTAIRACADNYLGAKVVGLNVKRYYALHVRDRRRLRRRGRLHDVPARRRDPGPRAGVHAARVRDRDRRRARVDGRGAARRRADRRVRGARRPLHRAVGEEHVQLRAADPGAALPAAGPARQAGVNRRAAVLLGLLAVALLALPAVVSSYVLSVATLILFFAYAGQAWNVMMGFAGQLSLGHSLYVGVGAYAAAGIFFHYGIGPWAGIWLAIALCVALGAAIGFLAFRFGISGVYFALLTIAFAEFTRIGFDHIDWLGGPGGLFIKVAQREHLDLLNLRGPPAMFYYLMLALTAARSRSARGCCAAAPATTGRRSAKTSRRRRRSASTPSAGRCSRW